MTVETTEIGDGIVRFSTPSPRSIAGVNINQFLIDAEEPLLFHCGTRSMFPEVREVLGRLMPLERLRWLSFGHVEADEMGAMNLWLAAAPNTEVLHSPTGCLLSVDDLADRTPRALPDGGAIELGGRRVRLLETPHVPHNAESIMLFEEMTATLLCGDVGTNGHLRRAVVDDLAEEALAFGGGHPASTALTPDTPRTLRRLAGLAPRLLAVMHGASFVGDGATQLEHLAAGYAARMV
ncbi:MAG: MBL fold metallo-hydrolase [Acidimicrobiales bacterium]